MARVLDLPPPMTATDDRPEVVLLDSLVQPQPERTLP